MLFELQKIKKTKPENRPMEEVVSSVYHGCNLAKELEKNLPNIVNQPQLLIHSCDEIIREFGKTRERLMRALEVAAAYGHHVPPPQMEVGSSGGGGVLDWLRVSQAMDILNAQLAHQQHHGLDSIAGQDLGSRDAEASPMDIADASRGSSLQRPRKRKDEADRRTLTVPAPRMGNTEVPPEDGFTWRKYGQKDILGSKYPRGYYRCTHQKLYNCPAKKQVQRLDDDPYTFEVTYRGEHTCTMSSTAPSIQQPPPEAVTTQSPPPANSLLTHWLTMDIKPSGEGTSGTNPSYNVNPGHGMQMYREQFGVTGAGPSGGGATAGAGPSSTNRYVDYPGGVVDLADAMFNSGSSSNNSMELIFSSMEEKWEGGDKKN